MSKFDRRRLLRRPHIVETIVPLGGFGKTLNAMLEFHTRNGIRASIQPGDAM
jgi:hypothetical protein